MPTYHNQVSENPGEMAQPSTELSSRKRSHSDMRSSPRSSTSINEDSYRTSVLKLPAHLTEDALDEQLQNEARSLGLPDLPPPSEVDLIASSLSATTVETESNKQGSILSQSTAPTSCSSSEHRPTTRSSVLSKESPPPSSAPSMMSDMEKRRSSGFRNGIRKMAAFKKRKSNSSTPPSPTHVVNKVQSSEETGKPSTRTELKSPGPAESVESPSLWPVSSSTANVTSEPQHYEVAVDQEALQRSNECKEMQDVRTAQLDEKRRFLDFQQDLIGEIRAQRDRLKADLRQTHESVLQEHQAKTDKAVEDLEARQLEEEIKMQKEHNAEKQKAMTRLKHMEAYCQNPTPPPTPVDPVSGRPSIDALPERKVTDKDYHNLAQQYRERDAMDSLHASKINVLRGRQKKAVEAFVRKKELELEKVEAQQGKEMDRIDKDFATQEANLVSALSFKRARIERRWRLQALLELTKKERSTGLKYAPLSDVVAVETAMATA